MHSNTKQELERLKDVGVNQVMLLEAILDKYYKKLHFYQSEIKDIEEELLIARMNLENINSQLSEF